MSANPDRMRRHNGPSRDADDIPVSQVRLDVRRDLVGRYAKDASGRVKGLVVKAGLIRYPTLADAILDRLVYNAHRLNLTGESIRKVAARNTSLDLLALA